MQISNTTASSVTRLISEQNNEGKRDAETKGFLTDRAADRGSNHPDHCSYRHSELAARPHGGQRGVCCRERSYRNNWSSHVSECVSDGGLCDCPVEPGRRAAVHSDLCHGLPD